MKRNIFLVVLLIMLALIGGFVAGYSIAPKPVETKYLPFPSINETIEMWADYHQDWLEEAGFIIENRTLNDQVYGSFRSFEDFLTIAEEKNVSIVYRYEEYSLIAGVKRVTFWFYYIGASGRATPYTFRVF